MPKSYQLDGRFKIPANPEPAGVVCFCINLPDDPEHFAIFWGALDLLTKPRFWDSSVEADREAMAAYYRQIVADNRVCFEEILAMANRGCGDENPTNQRVTEDGIIEQSFDNGATWEPIPDDPRFTDPIYPPLVGVPVGELPCVGATSAAAVIKLATDQLIANEAAWATVIAIIETIASLVSLFLPGVGRIIAVVIGALAAALVALGRTALTAGMTQAVYDQLLCIFYCHIGDDASFTQGQWQAVKADIQTQIADAAANIWLYLFVNLLGPVGLTSAARALPTVADCSDCNCAPCSTADIFYRQGADWLPAVEIGVNLVRCFSTSNMPFSNEQYCFVRFGEGLPDDCCTLDLADGWTIPVNPKNPFGFETRCDGTQGGHAYPWPIAPTCVREVSFRSTENVPWSIDIEVFPEDGCP